MTAVPEIIPKTKTQRNEQHAGNSQHAFKTSSCAKNKINNTHTNKQKQNKTKHARKQALTT